MNVPARLAAFAAVLGLAFGGAVLAGAAIDLTDEEPTGEHGADGGAHHGNGDGGGDGEALGGLAVSQDGYTLEVDRALLGAGDTAQLTFRITDERGQAVRDGFQIEHEKELHLIVVRRDTATFDHVHPSRGADGTWSVDLTLRQPGVYRAYADFAIGGHRRTLAADLFVPGDFRPVPLAAPEPTARAADLDVTLDAPGARAGRETRLTFAVNRGGQPFDGLEPYLGAKGHLVVLREGDLGYLHAHPTDGGATMDMDMDMDMEDHGSMDMGRQGSANQIEFAATFPTAGRYRLFLQFNSGGEIRTVSYTLAVPR